MRAAIKLEAVKTVDQRAARRYKARGGVSIESDGASFGGVLTEISAVGAAVRTSKDMTVDTTCNILIVGLGAFEGRVARRISENGYAIAFEMGEGAQAALDDHLAALYEERDFIVLDA
ncbi:MAG: PilZ domain-containing protein [Pseudomonadota bacterium]